MEFIKEFLKKLIQMLIYELVSSHDEVWHDIFSNIFIWNNEKLIKSHDGLS